ncbi:hypothetical protein AYO44_07045 [Planctomycetaceae bacterium SCGC AG-212-F19]|nr:hypothetical protein AYO44_07045 [Planctomycetaceae bacterium SCGC AG-212-F19]
MIAESDADVPCGLPLQRTFVYVSPSIARRPRARRRILKVLDSWLALRLVSRTRLQTLARFEPGDEQTAQANAILTGVQEHGRAAARFVAGQTGSSESGSVLWWVQSQLADDYSRDNDSAARFADVRLIVDNPLLQVEATTGAELSFMRMAIEEARMSVAEDGRDHPKVGAVVMKDGVVLATAHRGEMGEGEHAEYTALEKKLPDQTLAGATVYATLEPCTHRGPNKTPCAQRLIDRKVRRVVIGMLDPNMRICGKGERMLRDRGIVVDRFPHKLILELEEINRAFVKAQNQATSVPPAPLQVAAQTNCGTCNGDLLTPRTGSRVRCPSRWRWFRTMRDKRWRG